MLQFVNAAVERQKLRILCTRVFAGVCVFVCMCGLSAMQSIQIQHKYVTNTYMNTQIRNVHIYAYMNTHVNMCILLMCCMPHFLSYIVKFLYGKVRIVCNTRRFYKHMNIGIQYISKAIPHPLVRKRRQYHIL